MAAMKAMLWTGPVYKLVGKCIQEEWKQVYTNIDRIIAWYSLLTGDNNGRIYQTVLTPSGCNTESNPFKEHRSSVEDLQWSPTEQNVFASCSADQTVKIWDTRDYMEQEGIISISKWSR
jgi:WD40 repeat protein